MIFYLDLRLKQKTWKHPLPVIDYINAKIDGQMLQVFPEETDVALENGILSYRLKGMYFELENVEREYLPNKHCSIEIMEIAFEKEDIAPEYILEQFSYLCQ